MFSTFLLYSLKAALVLTLLYVPYTLLLQQEKFFRLNRMVLIGILLLSLILPLCNVSWLSLDHTPIVQAMQQQMVDVGIPVQMAQTDIVTSGLQVDKATSSLVSWFMVLAIVYVIGMATAIMMRLAQLGILSYALIYRNLWMEEQSDGTYICCRQGDFSPYSWINSIVISQKDWDENRREIILHETGHILHHHSMDMLLLMLCQAVQWYNPFVWMLGNSLADVHEFEADDHVLRQGVEAKDYQMLLLRKAIGASGYAFTNGLGSSKLGARIAMMKYPEYNLWRITRALYILPLMVLSLSIFSTPELMKPFETIIESLKPTSEQELYFARYARSYKAISDETGEVLPRVDKVPQFDGGREDLLKCLHANIHYPRIGIAKELQGTLMLSYVVEKDGQVDDINCYPDDMLFFFDNAESNDMDAFYHAAIHAITHTSGRWKPAELNGQPVRMRMYLPVTFSIEVERNHSFFTNKTTTRKKCSIRFYLN